MSDFDIIGAASSGMQAQRAAMDILARNVALAQTGDSRHPAHGLVPDFATVLASSDPAGAPGEPAGLAALESQLNGTMDDASVSENGAAIASPGRMRARRR